MSAISRLLPRPSHFRLLLLLSASKPQLPSPCPLRGASSSFLRHLSTGGGGGDGPRNNDLWNLNQHAGAGFDPFGGVSGEDGHRAGEPWPGGEGVENGALSWESPEIPTWNLYGDPEDLDFEGELLAAVNDEVNAKRWKEEEALEQALEQEEKALISVLKGPDRAFGDLIAASGITDAMLDSLIALKDFEGVQGLPPLSEIEEERYEKSTRRSIRAEMERQKQEEAAKARVRKVDEHEIAYGTGRRKCSIARVWIQRGEGKFVINDKEFDVYFPMLDHRAALLQPFTETKTLGLWDVRCHVQGGGVSGQVGAIQLGVSRALQNWEPGLRPPLRSGGFLTRDSRVVERKKPGKAKARKSFQWVKR